MSYPLDKICTFSVLNIHCQRICIFGQNCTINCLLDICQEAETDVQVGPGAEIIHQEMAEVHDILMSNHPTHRAYEPQSGVLNDASIMKVTSPNVQNVDFADQHDTYEYTVDSTMDPTRSLQDSDVASLDKFFGRPIKIAEEEWGTSNALAFDIDPWSLYFDNKRVSNRLSNYNLLKARLRVKVVINGNGFQYGRVLVSYLPFDQYDTLSSNAALVPQDLVQASQQPHIYLDPTSSTGGEMVLPFFWYENYMHIPTSAWSQMGQMYFRSLNDLKHANGAADKVTVSVFAWAEDVGVSVLTSQDLDTVIPQMGDEVDQANSKGVISGPATALAKVSNALAVVPQLRPFALATSSVATAVAGAAKSFGYSRPSETKNPTSYRQQPISHLAATCVPDTALKLSVDDKQELTIDPRIAGLGSSDPMVIKDIAKRESYLTQFTWAMNTAPETLLWNGRISPVTWAESGGSAFHFPACAMAALPFKYWTGSMKFRFQIVCSAFHKGRLKIVYDPNFLSSNEYNTNFIQIVDIADTQDFTIEVGNGQPTTLLSHHKPGIDSVTQMYSTVAYASHEAGNGVLGVYIVNELTTPNSLTNNDIEINVFVSMGDDFEVFVPDDHFQAFVFKPQSGEEARVADAENTAEPSAPVQTNFIELGPDLQDNALVNLVYTGESVLSFRTLLKRYNLSRTSCMLGSTHMLWNGTRAMFPPLRGNVSRAIDLEADGVTPYNYFNTVLLHWVTYAHSGWRGGIRYKLLANNLVVGSSGAAAHVGEHANTSIHVQRGEFGGSEWSDSQVAYNVPTSLSECAFSGIYDLSGTPSRQLTGPKGMVYAESSINPTIEYEIPFYSPFRFSPGKTESLTGPLSLWTENYHFQVSGPGSDNTRYEHHVAAAEDFQVYFWTGLPRMYYETIAPNPDL